MSKSEFLFFLNAWHSYAWKLYRLFFISTFSMTIWDTLVQILAHNSNNKYGFQAKDWVQNFLHTLLDLINLNDLNHLNNLFDLIDLANYSKSKEWNDWNDWNEWIGMKWLKYLIGSMRKTKSYQRNQVWWVKTFIKQKKTNKEQRIPNEWEHTFGIKNIPKK